MAQNPKNGKRQSSGFLFERSDLDNQLRVALIERWERDELMLNQAGNSSQNNMPRSFLSNKENVQDTFLTPPLKRDSVATPRAPMKQRKSGRKANLKPKRLVYSDGESDTVASIADSGINSDSSVGSLFQFKVTPLISNGARNSRKTAPGRAAKGGDNLSAIFEKIRLRSSDKENRNVIERLEKRTSGKARLESQASLEFSQEVEPLSQCISDNWQDVLSWLQPHRDVGLWVQCCSKTCQKWRYTEEYHDPIDVPEVWYCEMNVDKSIASCNIPQKSIPMEIKSDLIENKYNAGSIVWARVVGFPWWPAMVDDCPYSFQYYQLAKNSIKPVKYHVIFFHENNLEHNWLPNNSIKPFVHNKYQDLVKRTIYCGVDYKNELDRAYHTACNAVRMSILGRLQKYSFLVRYTTLFDSNNNSCPQTEQNAMDVLAVSMGQSSEDEIPASPESTRHTTLKDYYTNVLLPKKDKTMSPKRIVNSWQHF